MHAPTGLLALASVALRRRSGAPPLNGDVRRHMTRQSIRPCFFATTVAIFLGISQPTLSAQVAEPAFSADGKCQYDRPRLLALEYQAFDQTPGQGWREHTEGDKCSFEAADLIRDYRTTKNFPHPMLYWHEGQLRALGGATNDAIPLMELSRPMANGIKGWNEYVDATIAFLRKDREAYVKARAALAAVPQAPYLSVVDRLGQCFDKPYAQAYRACEQP